MEKTTLNETNTENTTNNEVNEKPYQFRKLAATDIFLMSKIISKIGIDEFTSCFEKDEIKNLINRITNTENNEGEKENVSSIVGVSVFLEIANVIFKNLPSCEVDIYQILSNTSNLSVFEVKELEMSVFAEMVIDFIKQDGFSDFFKVVSKLLK